MANKREQELEHELKKYKAALFRSEVKYEKEKEKRLAEHKKVISLTRKAKTLKNRQALFISEQEKVFIHINHELLTPLTLIYSSLKQVLNSRQIPHELRNKLEGVFKQAHRMKNIIRMILNMQCMEVGQNNARIACPAEPYLNECRPEASAPWTPEITQFAKFHSVLIVESDPDLCDFMAANLQAIFEKTYTARDGMEALPVVVSQLPQIIICDVKLPRISGPELCRKVKQNPRLSFIPVILLASDVDMLSSEEGYKTGADAYVAKPFDMDVLMAQVQNVLNNRTIIRQHYQADPHTDKPAGVETTGTYLEEQFVIHLNKVIADNLSNTELNVNMIAKLMCMSRASLYSKVKAIVGVGVNEYMIKQRIRYTQQQLMTTDSSIRDISEKAGFLHQRNFSATFKNITGYTPTDYRKKREEVIPMKETE